jgi:hypothetical protein
MAIIRSLLRTILAPFRFIWRIVSGAGSRTVRKTGAGLVAQRAGDSGVGPEDDTSVLEETGGGILFERLVRPSLRERLAADLSLDEAREYVAQAEKFYTFGFSLFPRSDQFYEEVEQQYLAEVLGRADGATLSALYPNDDTRLVSGEFVHHLARLRDSSACERL